MVYIIYDFISITCNIALRNKDAVFDKTCKL